MLPDNTARRRGRSRISARIVTVLPEPDSPIRHSTSPRLSSNDTPFTAHTVSSRLTNLTCRSSTWTSGSLPPPGGGRSTAVGGREGVAALPNRLNIVISPHPGALRAPTLPLQGRVTRGEAVP